MSAATLDRRPGPVERPAPGDQPLWVVAATSFLPLHRRVGAARWVARLPLGLVLAVQAVCSLRLTNSAFQDEALYLHTGRLLLAEWTGGETVYSNPAAFFSGAPQLYPVWAGLLDQAGGLPLARAFSTLCMLSATVAVYLTTQALLPSRPGLLPGRLGPRPGLLAAAVFALSGSVLFLGHFATFDAPSFALVAWAATVAARTGAGARGVGWSLLVGALCALAVLVKYSSAVDVPFVLALVPLAARTAGVRGGLRRGVVAGVTCAALLGASALTWAAPLLAGLRATTTDRTAFERLPAPELLADVARWDGVPLVLMLAGAVVVARRHLPLAVLLAVATVAAPGYQIHLGEFVSLHKHVVLGLVLGAPLAGAALAALARSAAGTLTAAGIVWLAFLTGVGQAQGLYAVWPDSTALQREVTYSVEAMPWIRMVGDTPEPLQYGLQERTRQWQWTATYENSFTYQGRTGLDAYRRALRDNYFQLAFFDGSSPISRTLMPEMSGLGFRETSVVRTPWTGHAWHIYQRFDHLDGPGD